MNDAKKTVKKNNVTVIQKKDAQAQLKLLTDFYDIDMDFIPADAQTGMELCTLGILKHIMRGRLEIKEENGRVIVVQNLVYPVGDLKQLKYKNLGGIARLESDKGDKQNEKVNYLLGSLSGGGPAEIEKLDGVDRGAAECVANLFFVV